MYITKEQFTKAMNEAFQLGKNDGWTRNFWQTVNEEWTNMEKGE